MQSDVTEPLPLKDNSVQCVVTSPPYWGLRDYGIKGQLGLELTPELYIERMVAVFREVKRVLRDDGTVWCNLGDSYCTGTVADRQLGNLSFGAGTANAQRIKRNGDCGGLKAKDLVGIPWRVAFALQQPYYAGKIKRVEDRIWLAAMIDGEGCMFIHKRKVGQSNGQGYERQNDSYGAGLEVANTHRAIVNRCLEITGAGSICTVERETRLKKRNIPLHRWNLRSNQCRDIIREIYPYLVGKQHEARLLLGCPSSGKDAELAHAGLIALHRGYTPAIDFPAPKSMYEPGWYLRSDIIWSKCNPMPESVTDRPTKAHEYIFLLTKNERYYFDQDAVREPPQRNVEVGWKDSDCKKYSCDPRLERQGSYKDWRKYCPTGVVTSRNIRTVWEIATQPYPQAHFATFPEAIAERCIKAGSKVDDIVLDPFSGAGTTALVADKLGRFGIGLELKLDYCQMAHSRCYDDAPLLSLID